MSTVAVPVYLDQHDYTARYVLELKEEISFRIITKPRKSIGEIGSGSKMGEVCSHVKLRGSQHAEQDFPFFRRGFHRTALSRGPDLGPSMDLILAAGMCFEAAIYRL